MVGTLARTGKEVVGTQCANYVAQACQGQSASSMHMSMYASAVRRQTSACPPLALRSFAARRALRGRAAGVK